MGNSIADWIAPGIMMKQTPPLTTVFVLAAWLVAAAGQADILSRLDRGEQLTISAVGTSLTDASHSYWFARMGTWLNSLYPGQVTLDNESISGSASPSGIGQQVPAALTHNPDAVFIEFAVNDAYTPYNISRAASAANLQTMIDQINTWAAGNHRTVDIIVQTMNNTPRTDRADLPSYYQAYRDIAAANHLLLIDHYANWLNLYNSQPDHATWNSYVPDTLHPNDLGAQYVIVPDIQHALLAQTPEPAAATLLTTALMGLVAYAWRHARSNGP
jgi:lysophospholipase L1-like esterase